MCRGKPSIQVSVSRTPSYSPSLHQDPRSELDLSRDETVGDAAALKPASSQPSLQKAEQRGGLAFSVLCHIHLPGPRYCQIIMPLMRGAESRDRKDSKAGLGPFCLPILGHQKEGETEGGGERENVNEDSGEAAAQGLCPAPSET